MRLPRGSLFVTERTFSIGFESASEDNFVLLPWRIFAPISW